MCIVSFTEAIVLHYGDDVYCVHYVDDVYCVHYVDCVHCVHYVRSGPRGGRT